MENIVSILLTIIYGFVGCQIVYIFLTRKNRNIVIRQKFTITSWGFTKYIVVDSNNVIYEISSSWWFAKNDAITDWIKLKVNKKYNVFCYGFTSRIAGLNPQIIDVNN